VSETVDPTYAGAADADAAGLSLARRFRRHAEGLRRHRRSPLCAQLMLDAAADLAAGGLTARLFEGVPVPPGSVPQLRLLAALHHLVLAGRAPELAAYYPSAGGTRPPERVWPAAVATLEQHFDWVQQRLHRTVQTNEPGRSAVLFSALLWLTDRYRRPIRLLEIGASAGLNLIPDRYCYLVDGRALGDPSSPLRFDAPWQPGPLIDVHAAARDLRILARGGCDQRPLDPRQPEDRLTLMSYIWADELNRIERLKSALDVAAACAVPIATEPASAWLARALADRDAGELTVIWQSIFRQYVASEEWAAIEDAVRRAADRGPPVAWLAMEPTGAQLAQIGLSLRSHPDEPAELLAHCGDHGPPVMWYPPGTAPRAEALV
jgi:hypothetical protein